MNSLYTFIFISLSQPAELVDSGDGALCPPAVSTQHPPPPLLYLSTTIGPAVSTQTSLLHVVYLGGKLIFRTIHKIVIDNFSHVVEH